MNRREYYEMESRYKKANRQLLIIVVLALSALMLFTAHLKNKKMEYKNHKKEAV